MQSPPRLFSDRLQFVHTVHDYIHCTLYYLRFVDFGEGKIPEYLAENSRSTGDINHRNSIDSREIPRWS